MVSKRREVIQRWIDGYQHPDRNTVTAFRSAECPHIVPSATHPVLWDNDKTIRFFTQFEDILHRVDFTVHDWVDDNVNNKIGILFTLTSHFAPGLDLDPYTGKYYIIFHFNEAQDTITKFIELVDFANTPNYLARVNQGREKLGLKPLEHP
jgi:hypothetical protein